MKLDLLTKIYTTINNKIIFNRNVIHPSVKEQNKYLLSFPEPRDRYAESFYKYKCVLFYFYNFRNKVILNILSFFALIFFFFFYRLKGLKFDKQFENYKPKNLLLCKASKKIPIDDIFPNKRKEEYLEFIIVNQTNYLELFLPRISLKVFFEAVKRHPLNPHYLLVLLVRISQQSYYIEKYNPRVIMTYVCEREFSDPILTLLSEKMNIHYEGFMHGDYPYSVDMAFMDYYKYWVWDEHYVKMFRSLRCKMNMEIYKPGKYSGIAKLRKNEYEYYVTYYLNGEETENTLLKIRQIMDYIANVGKKGKIRPHPRFSDLKKIKRIFKGFYIENTERILIENSLESTYLVLSSISTVLSQAYYSGKKIVIDDCSDEKHFKIIQESSYILIDKADMFLSELLNMLKETT